jgi:RNA polymerase sigma-70 factor (ECF subfamily)
MAPRTFATNSCEPREQIEGVILSCCQHGDLDAATTRALQAYGSEIMGFLLVRLRDDELASEAFSEFTRDLWRGIGGFRGRSSVRVWAYVLARHAASRVIADSRRRQRTLVPLSDVDHVAKLAAEVRTETLRLLRTGEHQRLSALRDQLPEDDRSLLILRVNERMEWKDIALVMSYDGGAASPEALAREAARLRKRFQLVRERLRALAIAEGLLDDTD